MPNDTTNLITPSMHEGELRILDTDLAMRLGFSQSRDIRKIIKRYLPELDRMGVRATVAQTPSERGGRPTEAYYLNRKQAIFITAKSETAEATDITIEIIERFDAYERGEVKPAIVEETPEMLAFRAITALQGKLELVAEQAKLQAAMLEVTQPKADALDKLAGLNGVHNLRSAAQQCGWPEQKFILKLQEIGWLYTHTVTGRKLAYSEKVKAGLMDVKNVQVKRTAGMQAVGQPMITQEGLAKLRTIIGPFAKTPAQAA
ncbi:phage regulatory protein/antirepressor Ant [Acetobacter orientalis]|uniref:phage regulatory protein/antirepressor Ant n=1 Tax=Acetobacter orientalis TaxID=146474 RepID=UPI00214DDD9E|nr:phage regulatory protein/antirepressor Ant [Acetobacter orientalis]